MAAPAAHRLAHVAGDALGDRRIAPVGLEAVDVEPEALAARPQMRVVEAALVGVERVVERPERPLARRRLGGVRGRRARAGAAAASAKWRKQTRSGQLPASRAAASAQRGQVKSA